MPRGDAGERLIIALDVRDLQEARGLVRLLRPHVNWFKVGSELYTAAGPAAIAVVHDAGGRVFLDLKFHDIPHTVAGAVSSAAHLGVAMLNVHIAGGEAMLRAAVDAVRPRTDSELPWLIGVTRLTSERGGLRTTEQIVESAVLAKRCGLDGVVASGVEAHRIKAACGVTFKVVTPGIRPGSIPQDDQQRIATPAEALRLGSDYLVVGRPVTRAEDPVRAVAAIMDEMERILLDRVI